MEERSGEAIQAFGKVITLAVINLFGAQSVRAMLRSQFPQGELALDGAGIFMIAPDGAEDAIKKWTAFLAERLVRDFGHDAAESIFRTASRDFGRIRGGHPRLMDDFLRYLPEGFLEKERIRSFSKEELAQRVFERTRELQELNARLEETVRLRTKDLVVANASLRGLLKENYEVGKMMVRRDLDLTRANARLEELDTIKTEFVSIAAHQLRTPLTGVRWSYQTLLDGESGAMNQEQRRLLESGLGATLRMVDLVNDLLSVARIEEGKFGIHLLKQPLMPLLTRLAGRYAALAAQKGIIFSSVLSATLPDIPFDEEKMEIAFDNVLDNALKYTEPGGAIALKVFYEKESVHVEVSDTGVGISQGQLHRVFTKFFRADNALRLHTSGTGLGLYVVKNIVEKHGGEIDVKSEEGKGSVFVFTLPFT